MRERFKPLDRVNLLNLPTLSLSHSGCSADDLPFLALSLWRRARTRALAASLADTGPSRPNPYPAEWWPKIWGLAPLFADPVLPASCQTSKSDTASTKTASEFRTVLSSLPPRL
ncbi:hypothetical protein BS78_03G245800 [Paspalum vaginatum]|nr:hypothetical protein BS78_03G245800 [Paspalum vaginatum]